MINNMMPNAKRMKEKLYEKIYRELKKDICDGVFPLNSQLPTEQEIAEKYNVSRITSKKATDMLVEEGILHKIPGKGTFVTAVPHQPAFSVPSLPVHTASETKLIGVIFESISDSFGTKLLEGIDFACNQNGYSAIIKFSNNANTTEEECIDALLQIPVEGIIFLCACSETYNQRILELSLASFPVVFVDRYLPGIPIPYVGIDHRTACIELTDKLFENGHTSLALAMCDKATIMTSVVERIRGYKTSCEAHNSLSGNRRLIIPGDTNMSVPEEQLNDAISQAIVFLEDNMDITGVVALSDGIAQILFIAAAKLKKEKNRNIKVAFFDATSHYPFFQSPAFAIRQDETVMGISSVETLINVIKHNKIDMTFFTPYHLDKF